MKSQTFKVTIRATGRKVSEAPAPKADKKKEAHRGT